MNNTINPTMNTTGKRAELVRFLKVNIPITVVLFLTLLLLVFVGFGEAKRTYLKFQMEKMFTQAEIIHNSMEAFLQTSIPLTQFSGFPSQSRGLLESDPALEYVSLYNAKRELIFLGVRKGQDPDALRADVEKRTFTPMKADADAARIKVFSSGESYRVELALNNKFGVAGYVVVESSASEIFKKLDASYNRVFLSILALAVLFIAAVALFEVFGMSLKRRTTWLKVAFVTCFTLMSLVIGFTVFDIYSEGALAKTRAFSDAMAQRLSALVELGIDFDQIEGLDEAFGDYQKQNPDINSIALTENGVNLIHTKRQDVGKTYAPPAGSYEYVAQLQGNDGAMREFRVAVTMPVDIVTDKIMSSAKNFITLFIACGLIAVLFLDMGAEFINVQPAQATGDGPQSDSAIFGRTLSLIKPAYFLIVFVNALAVPFLPQVVEIFASKSASAIASVSLPFTIYYAVFALALIPAGQYAERGNLKTLMAIGFICEMVGMSLVAASQGFWLLTLGRVFSGLGQGAFLIGLQSYILSVTPDNKRTQGAAVKVIARNAGLIAGSAIGALLFAFMDFRKVFMIASLLSMGAMFYLWFLVPAATVEGSKRELAAQPKKARGVGRMLRNVLYALKDMEFLKTLGFIGLVGKMAITGVVMFAVPLILSRIEFASEDIGQALMLFYIASIVMAKFSSELVDRSGKTRTVLFISALLAGGGMLLFGLLSASPLSGNTTSSVLSGLNEMGIALRQAVGSADRVLLVLCLVIVGLSNGLSTAPLQTHISKTHAALEHGDKSMTATYTFLERIGHMAGPAFVGQIMIMMGQSTLAISVFGIITLVAGFLFIASSKGA